MSLRVVSTTLTLSLVVVGLIGLLLVVVYLLAYYRVLGLVAVFSLVIAGIITYLLFVILGRTIGFTEPIAFCEITRCTPSSRNAHRLAR